MIASQRHILIRYVPVRRPRIYWARLGIVALIAGMWAAIWLVWTVFS